MRGICANGKRQSREEYHNKEFYLLKGSRDCTVVEHLPPTQASHQCGPGSIPGLGVICGLSLLLVLVLAPRGFSPGTPVFPSPQPTFPIRSGIRGPQVCSLGLFIFNYSYLIFVFSKSFFHMSIRKNIMFVFLWPCTTEDPLLLISAWPLCI